MRIEGIFFVSPQTVYKLGCIYYLVFSFLVVYVNQRWTLMEKDEE
jgi:hypothetical protein